MKFKGIQKKEAGKFIVRYDVLYETVDHKEKVYEMISRDRNIQTEEDLRNHKVDAVVMIMHDREGDKILLNREFRMPCGEFVFNFPAGLIEKGETIEESAARELKEETGLDVVSIDEVMKECYSAVGFTNEKNICVIGVADGEFAPSSTTVEEIEAAWYTKHEVREMLQKENFASRIQAYCYMWSKE